MKRQSYFIIALITALLCCSMFITSCVEPEPEPPTPPETETPALEITTADLEIAPEGQECEVIYTITNEVVEGGSIEAACPAEWITDLDYSTKGTVTFTALPNETGADRSDVLTITYTYLDGEEQVSVSDEINLSQKAIPVQPVTYDYEFEFDILTGTWYGTQFGNNGEDNYYVWLSDKEFLDGYTQPNGTYYLFDMYAGAPANADAPMPPVGTYTLGEMGSTEPMTFSPDYSKGVSYGDMISDTEIDVIFNVSFSEGTLTVSTEDNVTYTFEAILTDIEGKTHHVVYTGTTVCEPDVPEVGPVITEDIDFVTRNVGASYISDEAGIMGVTLQFTDMDVDYEGYVVPPGTILTVEAYMPFDENGYLTPGTYTVDSMAGADGTLYPGEAVDFFGMMFYLGTYATYYADLEDMGSNGLINSGTMTIAGSNGIYDIECDFTTQEGAKITCTYSGSLVIPNVPSEFWSTLTDDYTLDLSNAIATGDFYGDFYYTGGGNWYVNLSPADGVTGDGMQMDFVVESLDFSDGIPSGTYTASPTQFPIPGEYLVGYYDNGSIGGTTFLGGFTEDGYVSEFGPATEGDLIITNHGDGTYTFEFSFLDDQGYTWDGNWTGSIAMTDYSSISASAAPVRYNAKPQRGALTMEQRIDAASQNAFKVLHVDTGRASLKKNVK